mgnify:CR=1 FL=1
MTVGEKMKPIKVESSYMKRVLQSDNRYIQIGERKFLLVEVCHSVTGIRSM